MFTYVLLGVGILFLIWFLSSRDKFGSVKATILKTFTSLCFVATAVFAFLDNDGDVLLPATLSVLGLVFGLVGDTTLDLKVYFKKLSYDNAEKDSDSMMWCGMVSFAIGHVCYIASNMVRYPGQAINLLWSSLIAVGLVAVVFGTAIFVMKMNFGKFLVPCVCYGFLLCNFVAITVFNASISGWTTASVMLAVASVLFLVSDLVLSMTYFSKAEDYTKQGIMNPESRFMIVVNHVTYYAAQFIIALSLMLI